MPVSDVQLMLRVREGDLAAFDELVEKYQHRLFHFFHRLALDRQKAEDLTQEVFLRIYRTRHRYSGRAKFSTFLYRIARNLYTDECRKSRLRSGVASLDTPLRGDRGERTLQEGVASAEVSPDRRLERKELSDRMTAAIDCLPSPHKLVFLLAESQGLRYAEIAAILEIPVGTVKSRMYHAVRELRVLLGGEATSMGMGRAREE